MKKYLDQMKAVLNSLGLVGERRAVALGVLAFFSLYFTLLGLILRAEPPQIPPEVCAWAPCFLGLAACYGLGFFALGAGWFWGRWFAIGLGSSGVSLAVWSVIMTRQLLPEIMWFGILHGLVAAFLSGEKVAAQYDGREEWRKRFQIDEQGALRLRRSVTRAATSLPGLIVLALKPREAPGGMALAAVALVGMLGFAAMLRNRSWGVLAVGAAGAGAIAVGLAVRGGFDPSMLGYSPLSVGQMSLFVGAVLLAAFAPFARPVARYLSARG